MIRHNHFIFILFLSFSLLSCATIPKEAPLLSEQLGKEMNELEDSHISLVESFFDLKRKNVRDYLEKVWLPLYAETFFQKPDIKEMWELVATQGAEDDRLMFILTTAPELQADINQQYQKSVEELNMLERELKNALQQKYVGMRSINNTLTSFLASAAEVDENRQRYLDMAGLSEGKISGVIEQADQLSSSLLSKAVDVDKKVSGAEENLEKFQSGIKNLLNNFRNNE